MDSHLYHPLIMDSIPNIFKHNIDEALNLIGDLYNLPEPEPFKLNFERDTALIYAYFYRYFICISSAVKESWHRLTEASWDNLRLYNKQEMNVCCIGGGSGCDLVGFCQFLDMFKIRMKLNAVILDYYDWSEETRKLITNFEISHLYNISNFEFVRFNFFNPITDQVANEIQKAKLVTIVKFLSAVGSCDENTERLINLLSHVKKGALVFFMDNSGGSSGWNMQQAATKANLHLIAVEPHMEVIISQEESRSMDFNRFHTLPLKKTSVTAFLYIRR